MSYSLCGMILVKDGYFYHLPIKDISDADLAALGGDMLTDTILPDI